MFVLTRGNAQEATQTFSLLLRNQAKTQTGISQVSTGRCITFRALSRGALDRHTVGKNKDLVQKVFDLQLYTSNTLRTSTNSSACNLIHDS